MPEMAAPAGVGEVGEATSLAGSAIAQVINIVRTVISYVLELVKKLWTWAGEHPLSFAMGVINILILLS